MDFKRALSIIVGARGPGRAPRAPAEGDPVRLDGFMYVLTDRQLRYPDGKPTAIWRFERPYEEALAERQRANPNYRLAGLCLESELVWMTGDQFVEAVRLQAADLARGRPLASTWAAACVTALAERYQKAPPCWVVADRYLIRPTTIWEQVGGERVERVRLPSDPAEALELARALLDSRFHQE